VLVPEETFTHSPILIISGPFTSLHTSTYCDIDRNPITLFCCVSFLLIALWCGHSTSALHHEWFSPLHFHFWHHLATWLSTNQTVALTFQNLMNFLWSLLYTFSKFHANPPTTFWLTLLTEKRGKWITSAKIVGVNIYPLQFGKYVSNGWYVVEHGTYFLMCRLCSDVFYWLFGCLHLILSPILCAEFAWRWISFFILYSSMHCHYSLYSCKHLALHSKQPR